MQVTMYVLCMCCVGYVLFKISGEICVSRHCTSGVDDVSGRDVLLSSRCHEGINVTAKCNRQQQTDLLHQQTHPLQVHVLRQMRARYEITLSILSR